MWVVWVGLGDLALRSECGSAQRTADCIRFAQVRRPTTLLPTSRRAPRGCPGTVLGRLVREVEPSLPGLPWPRQASVIPFYYVTAITARGKRQQFGQSQKLKRHKAQRARRRFRPNSGKRPNRADRRSGRRKTGTGDATEESGSSRHLAQSAGSQQKRGTFFRQALARDRLGVCIVGITQLMLRVHQPDPPGLIHDDPRLLPPWRGSSLLCTYLASSTIARWVTRHRRPSPSALAP